MSLNAVGPEVTWLRKEDYVKLDSSDLESWLSDLGLVT